MNAGDGIRVTLSELIEMRHRVREVQLFSTPSQRSPLIGLHHSKLRGRGVDFDQVAVARGDSNSAGRRGIASSVNELMNRAVARELGRSRSPCPLRPPYKGPGSVKARARIMSSACIEGRLYVHQDCQRLIHTFRHWMGGEKLKHPFDAAGYICEHWLSPVTRAGAPYTLVR